MHSFLTRRSFTSGLMTAALSQSLPCSAKEPAGDRDGWIDAHVHVWHPDTSRYPISKNFQISDMQPPSFTDKELWTICEPAGVKRVVLIQMSFYELDHRYLSEVMQLHPGRFSGVSLIDWNQNRLQAEVKRHKRMGMRGFRMHSRGDAKSWPTDSNVKNLWHLAADHDLAICPLINPEDIESVDALCRQFPKTKVVVDHFARIGVSGSIDGNRLNQLCRLAEHSNTHVKASAFYALGKKEAPYLDLLPMLRQVCEAFGAERVMWASDCPYQVQSPHDYQSSINLITKHADFLSSEEKAAILRTTAERLFFS